MFSVFRGQNLGNENASDDPEYILPIEYPSQVVENASEHKPHGNNVMEGPPGIGPVEIVASSAENLTQNWFPPQQASPEGVRSQHHLVCLLEGTWIHRCLPTNHATADWTSIPLITDG